jgi:hypothetical protein
MKIMYKIRKSENVTEYYLQYSTVQYNYKTKRRNIPLEQRPQLQNGESLECPKNS